MPKLAAVILAAGQGIRMNSRIPKILHRVGGLPMVSHVFESAGQVADLKPILVVASGDTSVKDLFGEEAFYVQQPEQLGTGHATLMAQPLLKGKVDQVLVTYADMPLIRSETFQALADLQAKSGAAAAMLIVIGDSGSSFGRVLRDSEDRVKEIVEVAEARQRPDRDSLLAIEELNVGVYCFAADWLWANLSELPMRQARIGAEYYLTDLIEQAVGQDAGVEAVILQDADEALGAGTRSELIAVDKAFRRRINDHWLSNGVTILDPDTVYIDGPVDGPVSIGQDTVIWPNTHIEGETIIGPDCVLGPNTIIRHAQIGEGCLIESSVIEYCYLEKNSVIKPFTHIAGDLGDKGITISEIDSD
jgi:bifunctional UDP-N-acetylglucosamine pyrophosphorylase/glucosamine-1-phosphate N-acetyltransferase